MEISDFPWLPLEFSESTVFSILALHIVSRMRSHVFFVADLIDPYLSPRCITQNMALGRFFYLNQPYATHTLMTMGGILSIVSFVCGAQQYAPCRRHAHHAFLCCPFDFDSLGCWVCGYPQMISVICIQSVLCAA